MHAPNTSANPIANLPAWLSQEDAAEYAGVTVRTVRRYIAEGKLPASRLAGHRLLRIRVADIDALFEPVVTAGEVSA